MELLDADDMKRLKPIPFQASQIKDADWVLITHDHLDHCDPFSIPEISQSSPSCRFVGPAPVRCKLANWGIPDERICSPTKEWITLLSGLKLHIVPAAHPTIEYDSEGNPLCVGYILKTKYECIYISGDTIVEDSIMQTVIELGPVDTVILPVNESNFFRQRRGIVGNMSIREAFGFAIEVGAKKLVPVHWDMFSENAASSEEIKLIYRQLNPAFELVI